jgi:hypothetical protein
MSNASDAGWSLPSLPSFSASPACRVACDAVVARAPRFRE